jgi:hypothetical protein
MPDKRTHRGRNPRDAKLFAADKINILRSAVGDFSLLLTKGYAERSALTLVGNRFSLTQRQRLAVMRCACSDQQLASRQQKQVSVSELNNKQLAIDGYNILITIEAALSGGLILKGRDGCYRDLASVHGTYRKVDETIKALELIGNYLAELEISQSLWFLDSPVSNSGRLKTLMNALADKHNWPWEVQLVTNPDRELCETEIIVVSSDSMVLDRCRLWINLTAEIIVRQLSDITVIDLSTQ